MGREGLLFFLISVSCFLYVMLFVWHPSTRKPQTQRSMTAGYLSCQECMCCWSSWAASELSAPCELSCCLSISMTTASSEHYSWHKLWGKVTAPSARRGAPCQGRVSLQPHFPSRPGKAISRLRWLKGESS